MLCKITRMSGVAPEESRIAKLPKSEHELNTLLMDMGIGKENDFAYSITNVKTGNAALDEWFGSHRTVDIDELNHVAGYIKEFNHEQIDRFGGIISSENPENAMGFINIMYSRDDYVMYENVENLKELGEEAASRVEGIDPESPLGICINYQDYGEGFHDAHQGKFINGGYVFSAFEPEQIYDGVMLPGTDKFSPQILLALKVASHEGYNGADEPSGIWIELPATKYALDRVAHRLGEESIDNCFVYTAHYPNEVLGHVGSSEFTNPISEINTLAEVLSTFKTPAQMEKLEAVLEYEGYPELSEVIDIACNLDCYNYDPEITSAADFVIKYYDDDPVKLARADDLDGEKLLAQRGGKITENGFVARNDLPMKQFYVPQEPQFEQDQEMTMQ